MKRSEPLKITHIVDIAATLVRQSRVSPTRWRNTVAGIREEILRLFRDGRQTYEVVYARHFRRLVDEFSQLSPGRPGVS